MYGEWALLEIEFYSTYKETTISDRFRTTCGLVSYSIYGDIIIKKYRLSAKLVKSLKLPSLISTVVKTKENTTLKSPLKSKEKFHIKVDFFY